MNKGPFIIRRLGRRLLWRHPVLYRSFGLMRGRGDCFDTNFDVWIGGFPRSANTFTTEAFRLANPSARIASHPHIPPVIIRWLRIGKPGMFLIRAPEDAVVSWAIYWNGYLEESLDYYLDYHQALRPYAFEMFVVSFEVTTSQLGREIERFNKKFGTTYAAFEHNGEVVSGCFSRIEETSRVARNGGSGAVNELTVCRPSPYRAPVKMAMVQQLHKSPVLRRKLERANELYRAFVPVTAGASSQRPSEP